MTATLPTDAPPRTRLKRAVLPAFSAVVMVYLFAPIVWIVAFSFNKPTGKYNLQWKSFTLDNWLHPFADQNLTESFVRTPSAPGPGEGVTLRALRGWWFTARLTIG